MFENLLNHIKEQREKQQYINALATVNELQLLLLKEFSALQKGKATQQSVQADAGCALCGHGIGYHTDPAVGHQYQEPVAQPRR